ncbi:MAG: hypothetical protein AB8B82_13565 [Roseovarius sp.]
MQRQFPLLACIGVILVALTTTPAWAHVSEQAFVLLLPTQHYIIGGCLAVTASILLVSFLPKTAVERMFAPWRWAERRAPEGLRDATSLLSFGVMTGLIYLGFEGPRAPLSNVLPLMIWTGWWIALVSLLGLVGDLWRWVNPWTGLYHLIFGRAETPSLLHLPARWGVWPAWVVFIAFFSFFIADIAPSDPDRLALILALFWIFNFTGMALFGGTTWITRCEAFSVAFSLLARVSPFGARYTGLGMPGWDLSSQSAFPVGVGVFALTLLAAGSFDGLKETFWWLGLINVNPLEFPGRSAVVTSSLVGLGLSITGLILAFTLILWMGRALAMRDMPRDHYPPMQQVFGALAPAVLPIAVGYHISHFLVSFLIEGQYLLAALGDPLANGANIAGLADIRVTAGFLNSIDSVRTIWLTQAGAVLAGHVLSVLVSHHAALRLFGDTRRAALSQIPLGVFMIGYTLFGLWLLATPRGL